LQLGLDSDLLCIKWDVKPCTHSVQSLELITCCVLRPTQPPTLSWMGNE